MSKRTKLRKRFSNWLNDWNNRCIICGESFTDIECVTRDHIIPRSVMNLNVKGKINVAPAHHFCNNRRGNMPMVDAILMMQELRLDIGEDAFRRLTDMKVPNRFNQVKE